VGSAKIACIVVAPPGHDRTAAPRVIGFGQHRASGIKAGVVMHLDEAEEAVRAAVSQAERMAGLDIERTVLAVACGRPRSRHFKAGVALDGRQVAEADIARLMAAGRAHAARDGRPLIHLGRIGERLDGAPCGVDPIGMVGGRLEADLHAVSIDEGPLRNLEQVLERAGLGIEAFVAGPLASGLAVTTPEERRLGITVLDMGAGTTSMALFADGRYVETDAIAVGAGHITFDIARALATPLAEAERIKTLYGNILVAPSDEREGITVPAAGEEAQHHHITKAQLCRVIRPRMEEILALVRDRLSRSRLFAQAGGRVVLTGGASQMAGAGVLAANMLGRPVRIGRPMPVAGLPPGICSASYSRVIGLVAALGETDACVVAAADRDALGRRSGYLEQVGDWLRQSF
jgi:cell division protein FtsA